MILTSAGYCQVRQLALGRANSYLRTLFYCFLWAAHNLMPGYMMNLHVNRMLLRKGAVGEDLRGKSPRLLDSDAH